jgi:hypothetical protein
LGRALSYINARVLRLSETYGLHCVGIKATLFERILMLISGLRKPVDVYYSDIQKIHPCYGFHPSIALQREGFSDIQNREVNYKWLF